MRGTLPLGAPSRGPTRRAVAALLAGGFIVAASTTMLFLGMRSVLDVGGMCAEGGPYVIATPCPEGSPAAMILGVFGWFVGAALCMAGGAAVGGGWVVTPILAWSALFGSLGWNFLAYAFVGDGIEWGWLIPGVVFEAMAIVPLLAILPLATAAARGRAGPRPTGPGSPAARGPVTTAAAVSDRWDAADTGVPGSVPGGDADALVGSLERLATLHASGQLTDEEFARAKDAVLDAEREGAP